MSTYWLFSVVHIYNTAKIKHFLLYFQIFNQKNAIKRNFFEHKSKQRSDYGC